MKEIQADLWSYQFNATIVITTNGTIRKDGACVMGRGVARQAVTLYPSLPHTLGDMIKKGGNHVHYISDPNIFSFPVKHNWWELADVELIKRSVNELVMWVDHHELMFVAMPRPGCGNGGLTWDVVRPLLVDKLDDRFTICEVR